MEKKKKPYCRPELKGKIAFEASGVICCKLTNAACSNATKTALGAGKSRATDTS